DRNQHRVPEPIRISGVEQQLLDVRERRAMNPERVALARQQLLVRLERRDHHPIERKQQHEQKHAERQPQREEPARRRLQVAHSLRVDRRLAPAHLLSPPCCHARRCNPKYENRIAASKNGTMAVAIAAPSPKLPPGMARWNESVAIKCVALSGPPRVST